MSATDVPEARKVESIFHPSDFSEASEVAFAHALKIALVAKTKLTMLHVSSSPGTEWQDFPGVRDTLERWQLIPKGSSKSAVGQLGIDVRKVIASSKDPVKACLGFLEKHPEDLIVLAVHQDKGRTRWLEKSVGKPIAREAGQMTLFIPHGVEGFISRKDGSISLRNVLIPVTSKPRPQPSVEAAARLISNLRLPVGTVTLLHVGPPAEMPSVWLPERTNWTWNRMAKSGEPADTILQTAGELRADHHHAVLALAVDPVQEAKRAPVVGRQLAALERFEALDEQIDVFMAGEAEAADGRRRGRVGNAHRDFA